MQIFLSSPIPFAFSNASPQAPQTGFPSPKEAGGFQSILRRVMNFKVSSGQKDNQYISVSELSETIKNIVASILKSTDSASSSLQIAPTVEGSSIKGLPLSSLPTELLAAEYIEMHNSLEHPNTMIIHLPQDQDGEGAVVTYLGSDVSNQNPRNIYRPESLASQSAFQLSGSSKLQSGRIAVEAAGYEMGEELSGERKDVPISIPIGNYNNVTGEKEISVLYTTTLDDAGRPVYVLLVPQSEGSSETSSDALATLIKSSLVSQGNYEEPSADAHTPVSRWGSLNVSDNVFGNSGASKLINRDGVASEAIEPSSERNAVTKAEGVVVKSFLELPTQDSLAVAVTVKANDPNLPQGSDKVDRPAESSTSPEAPIAYARVDKTDSKPSKDVGYIPQRPPDRVEGAEETTIEVDQKAATPSESSKQGAYERPQEYAYGPTRELGSPAASELAFDNLHSDRVRGISRNSASSSKVGPQQDLSVEGGASTNPSKNSVVTARLDAEHPTQKALASSGNHRPGQERTSSPEQTSRATSAPVNEQSSQKDIIIVKEGKSSSQGEIRNSQTPDIRMPVKIVAEVQELESRRPYKSVSDSSRMQNSQNSPQNPSNASRNPQELSSHPTRPQNGAISNSADTPHFRVSEGGTKGSASGNNPQHSVESSSDPRSQRAATEPATRIQADPNGNKGATRPESGGVESSSDPRSQRAAAEPTTRIQADPNGNKGATRPESGGVESSSDPRSQRAAAEPTTRIQADPNGNKGATRPESGGVELSSDPRSQRAAAEPTTRIQADPNGNKGATRPESGGVESSSDPRSQRAATEPATRIQADPNGNKGTTRPESVSSPTVGADSAGKGTSQEDRLTDNPQRTPQTSKNQEVPAERSNVQKEPVMERSDSAKQPTMEPQTTRTEVAARGSMNPQIESETPLQQVTSREASPLQTHSVQSDARHGTVEDSDNIVRQIVRNAQLTLRNGRSEFRMRLEPENLGFIRMSLVVEDSTLTARVNVENQSVRVAIESNLPRLKEALAELGVNIDKFDVFVKDGSSHRQNNEFHRNSFNAPGRTPRDNNGQDESNQDGSRIKMRNLGYNTMELVA